MEVWAAFITGMLVGACLITNIIGVLSMLQEEAANREKAQTRIDKWV